MRTNRLSTLIIVGALAVALGTVAAAAVTTGSGSSIGSWGMMGGRYASLPAKSTPVGTLSAARSDARKLASRLGLRVDEVLQFQRNFYAKLVDNKGNGATEVLVDPASGAVSIEYGPAMMWNTRYGMGHAAASMMGSYGAHMMGGYGAGVMGTNSGSSTPTNRGGYGPGMMGGSGNGTSSAPTAPSTTSGTVSLADAHTLAQRWLGTNEPGVNVESGGDAFPGYYTLETLAGGKINGMISVNARTGAVWPHWWHGAFIAKSE